jgi:hypothetical protein
MMHWLDLIPITAISAGLIVTLSRAKGRNYSLFRFAFGIGFCMYALFRIVLPWFFFGSDLHRALAFSSTGLVVITLGLWSVLRQVAPDKLDPVSYNRQIWTLGIVFCLIAMAEGVLHLVRF